MAEIARTWCQDETEAVKLRRRVLKPAIARGYTVGIQRSDDNYDAGWIVVVDKPENVPSALVSPDPVAR